MKIITEHVHPAIATRTFDWVAYEDGTEEKGPYGHGATEDEAIEHLKEQIIERNGDKTLQAD